MAKQSLTTTIAAGVEAHLRESIAVKQALLEMTRPIEMVGELLVERLRAGNKILLFGNGGSAADAQHIAAEMVGRLEKDCGGLAAMALTTDTSILTAVANDYGFEQVFARQVKVLAREGDVVVGISTSGKSPNVVAGLREARARGAFTVGLVGENGAGLTPVCDHLIRVPSTRTMRIQECHITIGHILCDVVEKAFLQ